MTALAILITAAAAMTLGSLIIGSRYNFNHRALRWATEAALGLLVISYLIFFLSALHFASRANLKILFGGLAVFALFAFFRVFRGIAAQGLSTQPLLIWLCVVGMVVYLCWLMLAASLPATAVDEIVYHLTVPAELLKAGGLVQFRDNIYAYFPSLGEMLFLFGLALNGEVAAKLFHTLFGLLLALALYGFCRQHVPAQFSLTAALLLLLIPSVMVISSWAYVDLMFALYAFLALIFLLEFFETNESKWTLLSGIMAGAAVSTKYTGLQLLLLLVLLAFVEQLQARRKHLPLAPLLLVAVALAIALPYLWRNMIFTGWPLFPFNVALFELRPEINWDPHRASLYLRWLAWFGASPGGVTAWDILVAPLLVFVKARFNEPSWYDGSIGPVFLLTPLLLLRVKRTRRINLLIAFSLFFLFYWAITTRQVRFLIPLLPVLSFLLVLGLAAVRNRALYWLVGLLIVMSLGIGVKKVWELHPLSFWLGNESRESYLAQRLIGYPLYQVANRTLGANDQVYLVNMRNFGYYLTCRWRADFIFEMYELERFLSSASNAEDVREFFDSQGITHLLIDENITYAEYALSPPQRTLLQDFLRRRAVLLESSSSQALYRLRLD